TAEVRAAERDVEAADVPARVREARRAIRETVEREVPGEGPAVQLPLGAPEALSGRVEVEGAVRGERRLVREVLRDRGRARDVREAGELPPVPVDLEVDLPAGDRPAEGEAGVARRAGAGAAVLVRADRAAPA